MRKRRLGTRAQLAGIKPETMLNPATSTPAMALAAAMREVQSHAPRSSNKMDPLLVSAYVNAALFAFETLHPWLMASVGLKPEDYEARFDEIANISARLVGLAIEAPPREKGPPVKGTGRGKAKYRFPAEPHRKLARQNQGRSSTSSGPLSISATIPKKRDACYHDSRNAACGTTTLRLP